MTQERESVVSDQLMSIRAMCDQFEVTPRTLRFYEQKELLFPIREGQKRQFTRRDRARLKLILQAKRYGVSLEEIRQVLDLYDLEGHKHLQVPRALEVAERRLAEMTAERDAMSRSIAELNQEIAQTRTLVHNTDRSSAA